ncbi:hypothetical protein KSP40_PGU020815 [Platanthera guangdongensis]|uniref:Uncharacterized protein n=1 Tax=Platanthera guangdongensis TaxID=2320717 RepID=A0ABR2MDN1_9ASPA
MNHHIGIRRKIAELKNSPEIGDLLRSYHRLPIKMAKLWIEGDALNLPFEDGYFNLITVGYGLRNLIDRTKALHEIFRVLKPGGELEKLAREVGFSDARHYEVAAGLMVNLVATR